MTSFEPSFSCPVFPPTLNRWSHETQAINKIMCTWPKQSQSESALGKRRYFTAGAANQRGCDLGAPGSHLVIKWEPVFRKKQSGERGLEEGAESWWHHAVNIPSSSSPLLTTESVYLKLDLCLYLNFFILWVNYLPFWLSLFELRNYYPIERSLSNTPHTSQIILGTLCSLSPPIGAVPGSRWQGDP